MPNSESQLSTLAVIAAFMKEAYPALTLSIGKNGCHYAYRLGNIRIVRFFPDQSNRRAESQEIPDNAFGS